MPFTAHKLLLSPKGNSAETEIAHPLVCLRIFVAFTCIQSTLVALKAAATLANSLNARLTLLVPQVVPYPLPLEAPPLLIDFNDRRFRVLAEASPVETDVQIYLCRDVAQALTAVLNPRSIVIVAGKARWWWPTGEQRLAGKLRRAGHEVIFKQTEGR